MLYVEVLAYIPVLHHVCSAHGDHRRSYPLQLEIQAFMYQDEDAVSITGLY